MMLFVFQVETGRMFTLDMSYVTTSIDDLKLHLEAASKVPAHHQVLLMSGGEYLDIDERLCDYGKGTDTNPIFLFSKSVGEVAPTAAAMGVEPLLPEPDLAARLREVNDLPPSYNTIHRHTQLALQFHEAGQEKLKHCERLVHEQHLQNQAWQAVMANLHDLARDLLQRWEIYKAAYQEYEGERDLYLDYLKHFKDDLLLLQKIPVLPALLYHAKSDNATYKVPDDNEDDEKDDGDDGDERDDGQDDLEKFVDREESADSRNKPSRSKSKRREIGGKKKRKTLHVSLLEWISQKDDFMDTLYDICSKGLAQHDHDVYAGLEHGVEGFIKEATATEYKEISGLSNRLFGLDQLLVEAKKKILEQKELAMAVQRNNTRAQQHKDESVIPDLCHLHAQHLAAIQENHERLGVILRRCCASKKELCVSLERRLVWVIQAEHNLCEMDNSLVFHFECLQSLRRQLEILQQVHTAPATYISAVAEVVRRRTFSQAFLLWASDTACHLLTIHNEELARRKDFMSQFEGHFLSSLFPGMEDFPPSFATQAPSIFDSSLPKLSEEDLDKLKQEVPDLAADDKLNFADMLAITNFFMPKDDSKEEADEIGAGKHMAVEEKLMEVVNEAGLGSNMDQNLLKAIGAESAAPHLKDIDKGCESETDTEEFEKVGQSPFDLHFDPKAGVIPSARPGTQDASTLTEVGDKSAAPPLLPPCSLPPPPKKPPRTFQKSSLVLLSSSSSSQDDNAMMMQRTVSTIGDSFTNIKNPSLESIDELSSLKILGGSSNTDSCFNSHHQQMQQQQQQVFCSYRSSSVSPHTPLTSPPRPGRDVGSPGSPLVLMGLHHHHQQQQQQQSSDFVTDEFYIDESLPSSLSIDGGQHSHDGEFVKQLDNAHNVVALLQDNLQVTRSEHEKLRTVFLKLSSLARETHSQMKAELNQLKDRLISEKLVLVDSSRQIGVTLEKIIAERDNTEREVVQRLTVDHELEISDFRKIAQGKNEEIKRLRDENAALQRKLIEATAQNSQLHERISLSNSEKSKLIEELNGRVEELQQEKERTVKEVTDRLKRDHKSELESIRARFKLMTMERSPSENSLEKIDRGELSSMSMIGNTETLLLQMTENFESEKEVAVSDATVKEGQRWQEILSATVKEMEEKFDREKEAVSEETAKRVNFEKDLQIKILKQQITNLNLECAKHKTTVQQLAESRDEERYPEHLRKGFGFGEQYRPGLEKIRVPENIGMAKSVAICEGVSELKKVDASTSTPAKPPKRRSDPSTLSSSSSSSSSAVKVPKLTTISCRPGDSVVVIWNRYFENFTVLQESPHLHFLNSECLQSLNLKINHGRPSEIYCFAEVVDKEYCHARKPLNRFKVPKGTKFFRVRAKPTTIGQPIKVDLDESILIPEQPQHGYRLMSESEASSSYDTSSSLTLKLSSRGSDNKEPKESKLEEPIAEEKSGDFMSALNLEDNQEMSSIVSVTKHEGDIERATELTENFNVEEGGTEESKRLSSDLMLQSVVDR